jgi:hypothetical protein
MKFIFYGVSLLVLCWMAFVTLKLSEPPVPAPAPQSQVPTVCAELGPEAMRQLARAFITP